MTPKLQVTDALYYISNILTIIYSGPYRIHVFLSAGHRKNNTRGYKRLVTFCTHRKQLSYDEKNCRTFLQKAVPSI